MNNGIPGLDAIVLVSLLLQISGLDRLEYNTELLEAIERNTRPTKEEERH